VRELMPTFRKAKRYREMPVPDGNLIEACISLIATMNL